ncbi:hypothetical protein [Myroides odoratus]|uniref:hypothetical protein n=1 Tax=Myroides odoratus TaxID=256 RepID=UPI001E2A32E0|nr:hypothetical protein [Myroides odoratus]WQD55809.1 hypothetical protein U0010_09755 [Myroides odoratus]
MRKINICCLLLMMISFFYSCSDKPRTGFKEIDDQFKFINKIESNFDSLSKSASFYYLEKQPDSIYVVVHGENDNISRGWTYNYIRTGDWFFENDRNEVDSIVNYINYHGMHNGNTIKYFTKGVLQRNKGYYYYFNYNAENIQKDKPVEIEIELFYDKEKFVGSLQLFLFKDSQRITDYGDFLELDKDSITSYGEDSYYLRITPRDEGVNTIQGYYTLLPKKEFAKDEINVKPIFFRLDLDVK